MQREPQRLRCSSWAQLDAKLWPCAAVTLCLHLAMYGYGFASCRPGGHMWNTISGYEGGGMIDMSGTWLALPLAAFHRPLEDLSNRTCGGTQRGQRPAPGWDSWVCTPSEDIRAEESYTTWKRHGTPWFGFFA
ncbi:unnamed protein product [Effrenium voratum]|nr:unnamed protein product [Effrenium voratum]